MRYNEQEQRQALIMLKAYEEELKDKKDNEIIKLLGLNFSNEEEIYINDCKAYIAIEKMNNEKAIEFAKKYIEKSGRRMSLIKEKLVSLYMRDGLYDDALNLSGEILNEYPDNGRTVSKYANILVKKGDAKAATDFLNERMNMVIESRILLRQYIYGLKRQGRIEEMIDFIPEIEGIINNLSEKEKNEEKVNLGILKNFLNKQIKEFPKDEEEIQRNKRLKNAITIIIKELNKCYDENQR